MGKFDVFVKLFWTFWKRLEKGYKITFAFNSSVSSFCFLQNFNFFIWSSGFRHEILCTDYFVFTTQSAQIAHVPTKNMGTGYISARRVCVYLRPL